MNNTPLCAIMILLFTQGVTAYESGNPDFYEPVPTTPELIMGQGLMSQAQLVSFFIGNNPGADLERVTLLASLYIEEASVEGVNSDVAFVQIVPGDGIFTVRRPGHREHEQLLRNSGR